MRKRSFVLLMFLWVVFTVRAQDETARLLNIVDGILNSAEEKLAPPSSAAETVSVTFQIVNETGFTIKNILICRAGEKDWGSNYLSGTLLNKQRATINFNQPLDGTVLYNIRMIDDDGDRYSKYDVKLNNRSVIRIGISDFEFDK